VVNTATVYMPADHVYSPTLQNSQDIGFGPGMLIDSSNTGILEFDASNISSTIASHPITSATLNPEQIAFVTFDGFPRSFDINIYAFNGTGSVSTDLLENGTLGGTMEVGFDNFGDPLNVSLNASTLNQVLSHGSDLGFALVAQNPGTAQSVLATGEFGSGFHLHLTA
jgi:hypothetical protein